MYRAVNYLQNETKADRIFANPGHSSKYPLGLKKPTFRFSFCPTLRPMCIVEGLLFSNQFIILKSKAVVSWSFYLFFFLSFYLFMLLNDQILFIMVLTCDLTTFLWPNDNQKSQILLLNYYDLVKNIKHKKIERKKGKTTSWLGL